MPILNILLWCNVSDEEEAKIDTDMTIENPTTSIIVVDRSTQSTSEIKAEESKPRNDLLIKVMSHLDNIGMKIKIVQALHTSLPSMTSVMKCQHKSYDK